MQLSPCPTTAEPALRTPGAATTESTCRHYGACAPVLHNKRSHHHEKLVHWTRGKSPLAMYEGVETSRGHLPLVLPMDFDSETEPRKQWWGREGQAENLQNHPTFSKGTEGTSLVVQWLRLCTPNEGALGSIPGQLTRSHTPQPDTIKKKKKDPDGTGPHPYNKGRPSCSGQRPELSRYSHSVPTPVLP